MTTPTIVTAWREHIARTAPVSLARAHLRVERILGPHPCPVPATVIDLTDDEEQAIADLGAYLATAIAASHGLADLMARPDRFTA